MGIQRRKEARSRATVDKAAFIGMETEHSNDTTGEVKEQNQKLISAVSIQQFTDSQQLRNKELRLEAYKKQ